MKSANVSFPPPFHISMVFMIRNFNRYFCYVGQVSHVLALYVAQLIGINISPHMIEVYNTYASIQGLELHEMRAVSLLTELQQQHFDLAVVSHLLSS